VKSTTLCENNLIDSVDGAYLLTYLCCPNGIGEALSAEILSPTAQPYEKLHLKTQLILKVTHTCH